MLSIVPFDNPWADLCHIRLAIHEGAASRALLRRSLVAEVTGLAEDAVLIEPDAQGAPIIRSPHTPRLFISSASRETLMVAALSPQPIGIDIEKVDEKSDIPWNVLHPRERAFLQTLSEPHRPQAFARLWSVKEAFVKALGQGFEKDPASFEVQDYNGDIIVIDKKMQMQARSSNIDFNKERYVLSIIVLHSSII